MSHCGSYLQNRVSYKDIKCAAFFINLLLPLSWALAKLKYGKAQFKGHSTNYLITIYNFRLTVRCVFVIGEYLG